MSAEGKREIRLLQKIVLSTTQDSNLQCILLLCNGKKHNDNSHAHCDDVSFLYKEENQGSSNSSTSIHLTRFSSPFNDN